MSIFDGLEKLITEHGSATILRERLALAREQHDAEVGTLKSERDLLGRQLKDAQAEIQRLKQQVERSRPHDGLSELEVSILKLLATTRHDLTAQDVAQQLGAGITTVEFHLTKLEQSRFIGGAHYYTGRASSYSIAHAGRGYLVERGLA